MNIDILRNTLILKPFNVSFIVNTFYKLAYPDHYLNRVLMIKKAKLLTYNHDIYINYWLSNDYRYKLKKREIIKLIKYNINKFHHYEQFLEFKGTNHEGFYYACLINRFIDLLFDLVINNADQPFIETIIKHF